MSFTSLWNKFLTDTASNGLLINPLVRVQLPDEVNDVIVDKVNSGRSFFSVLKDKYFDDDKDLKDPPPRPYYDTVPVNKPEYINADLAKAYGMDVATAYQEALANTAHQREIKDLQAAGLNPVLSARYSGASGVSGAQVMSSSRGSSGSSSSSDDSPLGKILPGITLLAGLVAGVATKRPSYVNAAATAARTMADIFD